MRKDITHIICDFSDVLVTGLEGMQNELVKLVNTTDKEIRNTFLNYDWDPLWLGKVTENDQLYSMIESFQWNISVRDLKDVIRENFKKIPESWSIFRKLSTQYSLILYSVNAREWIEFLELGSELEEIFSDRIHFSYQLGFTKRSKGGFNKILNRYKISPSQSFLIDDSYKNIEVANQLGIESLRFLSPKQMNTDLHKLNFIENNNGSK